MALDISKIPILNEDGVTLVDAIFHSLEYAIVAGIVPPGSRLGEKALATHFGVSRGPLREALFRLEGRHVVLRSANAGVRVVELAPQDIAELYHIREVLEGLACRLAATNMIDEEIATLWTSQQKRERESGYDKYPLTYGINDFHYQVALGTHSDRLIQLLCGDLYTLIRLCRFKTSAMPERARQAGPAHKRIAEAIADRDPELAEMLMRRHIASAREEFVANLPLGSSRHGRASAEKRWNPSIDALNIGQ